LEELKIKLEKEYNQDVQQFTKDLDLTCIRHAKDLEELVGFNQLLQI
jgi:hypothetical protein